MESEFEFTNHDVISTPLHTVVAYHSICLSDSESVGAHRRLYVADSFFLHL